MKNLKISKRFVTAALTGTLITTGLSGCGKKMDCDIEYEHMHKYVSEEGFETYKEGEYEKNSDMFWTEKVIASNEQLEVISDFDLIRIDENVEALEEATKNDLPYLEYEYRHTYYVSRKIGKSRIRVPHTVRRFTTDLEHGRLTGRARDVDYKYKGYKIGENKRGKTIIIESELVDDLVDIKDEYPYFKLSDYKQQVYSDTYELEKQYVK